MIDVLVLLVVGIAMLGGWRQGLITSALSAIGWLSGIFLGIWATPRVLELFDAVPESEFTGALIALVVALVLGATGAGVLGNFGQAAASSIPFRPARTVDAAFGAVAMGLVALLAAWAAFSTTRPLLSTEAATKVDESRSWQLLERAVPDSARNAVSALNQRFADSPFPRVFAGDEPQVEVRPPDGDAMGSEAVRNARQSVVKVRTRSSACESGSVGSGWVVSDDRIVTNAHVVAGATEVTVQVGGTGEAAPAAVVAFDPELDLAILRADGLDAPALPRARQVSQGAPVVAAGFPYGESYSLADGRVRTRTTARGQDIYDRDSVRRDIYLIRTAIVQGNSGGPLLTSNGQVAGTVFAKSASGDDTGYALTDEGTSRWLDQAPYLSEGVPPGDCLQRS